jgi:hypothetical protein
MEQLLTHFGWNVKVCLLREAREKCAVVVFRDQHACFVRARTHHREKNDLPQSRVWDHLFPHSVSEDRSKKSGLGSSSKPKNCSPILKQKRGSQPFGHFKWPGVGPNELIGGSGGSLKATFWSTTFSRVRFHCPAFLPLHFLLTRNYPRKIVARVEMREKLLEAPPRPRQVMDGF